MAKRITDQRVTLHVLPDEMLTIEEAAQRIRMSTRYVRRAVAERRIAFHRLGRAIRIDPADLAEFMNENRVEPMTAESVWRGLRSVA
jgi:excisionase family DNA binding protein